jgi:hypothetical protein
VPLDPALQVNYTNPLLLSNNATNIAQWVASQLEDTHVALVSTIPPQGPNNAILAYQTVYDFRTATGSEIVVSYLYGQFYELDYRIPGTSSNPPYVANATELADRILSGPGSAVQNLTFQTQVSSAGPQFEDVRLAQTFNGTAISGALAENFDGSHYLEGSTFELLLGPSPNHLNRLFLISPDWFRVPTSFPVVFPPSEAAHSALFALNYLSSKSVWGTSVDFAAVSGHLYYLVTATNSTGSYYVFVNPRTGQAGFPTP